MLLSLLNKSRETQSSPSGEWKIVSPTKPDQIVEVCQYWYSEIDLALQGATEQKARLATISTSERHTLLKHACETLENEKQNIFKVIQSESGRTENDLEKEWSETLQFARLMCEAAAIADSTHVSYDARGVVAVLGSAVWPIFYSIQYLFLNFLAGNPVVLKPSEKTTATCFQLVKILRELHPAFHSLQLLVGEKEVGRRLACHELVSAVIFQGSFEMGMRVRQDTLSQPAKEILLFLGAKNPSVVFEDAPETVYETLLGDCFIGAGQDCHGVSVVFVQEQILEAFTARFHALSKEFKIAGPGETAFMGPLIDTAIMDRYFKFIGISEREGAEILMRGKPFKHAGGGHYVTPSLALFKSLTPEQMKKSVSLQTEILSPHVSLVGFKSEEELCGLLRAMNHGKSASIWSNDLGKAAQLAQTIDFGQIRVNGSLRDRSLVSFQARKRSGNHAVSGPELLNQLRVRRSII